MTIRELAQNWLDNDRTGDYNRKITTDEAETFIGYMDPDTFEAIDETITPEKFASAWNSIIDGE